MPREAGLDLVPFGRLGDEHGRGPDRVAVLMLLVQLLARILEGGADLGVVLEQMLVEGLREIGRAAAVQVPGEADRERNLAARQLVRSSRRAAAAAIEVGE